MTHYIKYQVDDREWQQVDIDKDTAKTRRQDNIVAVVSQLMQDMPISRVTVATNDGTVIRFKDVS